VTTGADDDQNVQNYLLPAGATLEGDAPGINLVDETTVKPEGHKPLPGRQHEKATSTQG